MIDAKDPSDADSQLHNSQDTRVQREEQELMRIAMESQLRSHPLMVVKTSLELARQLIQMKLVHAMRSATDTKSQDRAAFAIQELLKVLCCHPATPEFCSGADSPDAFAERLKKKGTETGWGAAEKLAYEEERKRLQVAVIGMENWKRFPEQTRDLIFPYLSSAFELPDDLAGNGNGKEAASTEAGTFYHPQLSIRKWLYLWCKHLISQSKGRYQCLRCIFFLPRVTLCAEQKR